MRETRCYEDCQRAGCWVCKPDGDAMWIDLPNAQALAALHHDRTGHTTWFESVKHVRYGKREGVGE